MFEFRDPGRLIDDDLELALVKEYPGNPDAGSAPAYGFEMRLADAGTKVGTVELRVANTDYIVTYAGHIGYEVLPEHRGHRYAARACRLLFPLARGHGLEEIWITCDPDNMASAKTCELAGGELIEIVDLPKDTIMYRKGERRKCRYKIEP